MTLVWAKTSELWLLKIRQQTQRRRTWLHQTRGEAKRRHNLQAGEIFVVLAVSMVQLSLLNICVVRDKSPEPPEPHHLAKWKLNSSSHFLPPGHWHYPFILPFSMSLDPVGLSCKCQCEAYAAFWLAYFTWQSVFSEFLQGSSMLSNVRGFLSYGYWMIIHSAGLFPVSWMGFYWCT